MRKTLVLLIILLFSIGVSAQDASVTVSDQVVVNGMVQLDEVSIPVDGWVVIHADLNGEPGHHVGIAQVTAGTNSAVSVMIDGAMSTPALHVFLHEDTGEIGVFEHADDPALDPMIGGGETMTPLATFNIAAIFAFDQQAVGDSVVIASTILAEGGWLVVHADNGGSPGAVLGQAPILAGTMAPVFVPIAAEGRTTTIYPMLHFDTGEPGVYEFGTVEGADTPVQINSVTAVKAVNLTDTPTLMLADGTPLDASQLPALVVSPQTMLIDPNTQTVQTFDLTVDQIDSPVAGFVDVHNDSVGQGHPGGSLGHAPIQQGANTGIIVTLISSPSAPITPTVFPMIHADTDNNGVYQYNRVVGVDLPIVLNGMVLTIPTSIGTPTPGTEAELATPEATAQG